MKILIYGGSFDPVHKGHYALLKAAIKQIKPDITHIFTAYQSPFKAAPAQPFKLRSQMAKDVLGGLDKNIIFDDFENLKSRTTYSYEQIEYIKKLYPDSQVYLLVGSDCLNDLHKWKNSEYIFKNAIITAGKRKGVDFKTTDFKYIPLEGVFPLVSSTLIRIAILCNGLLPNNIIMPQTAQTIEKKQLYGLNIHKWLQESLRPNRYLHVKLVAQGAVELAKIYGANTEAMALAAILHDAAKCMSNSELVAYCLKNKIKVPQLEDICKYSPALLHADVSADLAKKLFKVKKKVILDAIKYHTLGRMNMTLEEKILFVADMCSKDRRYSEARKVYQEAQKSLEEGMKEALRVKLLFTVQTNKWLAAAGIKLWNEIILKDNSR